MFKIFRLMFRNLRRNIVRSILTSLGVMFLVLVVTLVWSILAFLDNATREKSANFKGIATERWRLPSQMPFSYARSLSEGAAREPGDVRPLDSMTWQFFGGSLDPKVRSIDNLVFAFALEPIKLKTMMDGLDNLTGEKAAELDRAIAALEGNRQGLIVGRSRLKTINRRIGDRITLHGLNYRDMNLEFEIVGIFPEGRYDSSAAMNRDYLIAALDAYPTTHNGQVHPLADKTLNLVWLRVPDRESFTRVGAQIENSPEYGSPSVKFESSTSGVATFLAAYRDLIWGMRWLLAPAILVSLALVISNAISISARERRPEMAIMKVLGFRPSQIMLIVLGEAIFLGVISGFFSSALTYYVVNHVVGGIKFPIAFFSAFFIPRDALWWGVAIGGACALAGSIIPAWNTRSVSVANVFAKVA
jgi:putative ABC transport system permease protein